MSGVVADLATVEDRKELQRDRVYASDQDCEEMSHLLRREAVITKTE